MQDRLQKIFDTQSEFQEYLYNRGEHCAAVPYANERDTNFNRTVLLCIKELTEVLDEVDFKPHIKSKKVVVRDNIVEELVDVLKYWLNLCGYYGITADEIYTMFHRKSKRVREKIDRELDNAKHQETKDDSR